MNCICLAEMAAFQYSESKMKIQKMFFLGCLAVGVPAAFARPVPSAALMERLRASSTSSIGWRSASPAISTTIRADCGRGGGQPAESG